MHRLPPKSPRLLLLVLLIVLSPCSYGQRYIRDSSFAGNGLVIPKGNFSAGWFTVYAHSVIAQPDGKVVLGGAFGAPTGGFNATGFALMRFKANGTPDSTFGANGYYRDNANSSTYSVSIIRSVLTPAGQILTLALESSASGLQARVYCNTAAGNPDPAFGSGGSVVVAPFTYNTLSGIAVQPDGKILLGGAHFTSQQSSPYMMVRLNANGSIDNTFGQAGIAQNVYPTLQTGSSYASNMYVQADGRILFASQYALPYGTPGGNPLMVCRYKPNGTPDSTFAQNGLKMYAWDSTNVNPGYITSTETGTIYIGGYVDSINVAAPDISLRQKPFLVAMDKDGALISSFGNNGRVVIKTPAFSVYQPNDFFNNGGNSNFPVFLRQADGKFIISSTSDTTATRHAKLCRYTAAGAPDLTFCDSNSLHLPRGRRDVVLAGALQADGKILIAGGGYLDAKQRPVFGDSLAPICFRVKPQPVVTQGVAGTGRAAAALHVYPNPAPGRQLYIACEGLAPTTYLQITLTDATGRRLDECRVSAPAAATGIIPYQAPAGIAGGLYFLRMSAAGGLQWMQQVVLGD